MDKFTITRYSHHFVVKNAPPQVQRELLRLGGRYTQMQQEYDPGRRKSVWKPKTTFMVKTQDSSEYRLHIGQWGDFWINFQNLFIDPQFYDIVDVPMYEVNDIEITIREGWMLKDYQQSAQNYVFDGLNEGFRSPLLYMCTGSGKTFTSLNIIARHRKRFMVIVLARYVDKWIEDICHILEFEKKDIAVINNGDQLQRCTFYPDSGKPIPKAFIISLSTLGVWWRRYEEGPHSAYMEEAYGCMPYNLYQHLGIGAVINDEAHQFPHAVFKSHCYSHVPMILSLSGTMMSKDPVLMKVQTIMFPIGKRFFMPMDEYITLHACSYMIRDYDFAHIATSVFNRNEYSHAAYEKSVMRKPVLLAQYTQMILDLIQTTYLEEYIEDDRAIVFVATVKMAQHLCAEAKKRWDTLDIRTYLEADPYENVLEPDIRFTTVLSGGTAVDIKNLRRAYLTINIDSQISNAQALGRLRNLNDRDTHFYYLFCSNIDKHLEYHKNKIELFHGRVKEVQTHFLGNIHYR